MKTRVIQLQRALVRLSIEITDTKARIEAHPIADRFELLKRGNLFVKVDDASTAVLDHACERWIKTGKWPRVATEEQAILIWERVQHAYQFGVVLAASGFNSRKPVAKILRFLLIDAWRLIGSARMKASVYKREHEE